VVTTSFVQRGYETLLSCSPFQLVIVDDVDSLLRSGSNVERVLKLMGFSDEILEIANDLVKTRLKFYAALASGQESRIQELQSKLAELETRLAVAEKPPRSQLIIASATGRPKGIKHYLFKELLGFEVGGGSDYMRSVTDTYILSDDIYRATVETIKKLGKGTIVFVSQLYGKPAAKLLAKKLENEGVKAALALAGSRRAISKLASGEVDVVVGVASRYGVIVRGIDMPQVIRHAVFVEIPARRMKLDDALASPKRQLSLLLALREHGESWPSDYIDKLSRMLDKIGDMRLPMLAYKNKLKVDGLLEELVHLMKELAPKIKNSLISILLEKPGHRWRLGGSIVELVNDEVYIIIPDAPTYLQASGRTSRLFKGVMTHGLSVIITSSQEYVEALDERLKWFASTKIIPFESANHKEIARKIVESRSGKGRKVTVKTVLLVVESPTKARTIAWFWGRPGKRRFGRLTVYESSTIDPETGTVYLLMITASRGHLLELAVDEEDSVYGVRYENGIYKPVYTSIKRCLSCGYVFAGDGACPRCGSRNVYNANSIIEALRKLALEVDEVVIATDPDREGEKIAWDLYLVLRPYNSNIKRGRFHEVTRHAVLEALRNAGKIDKNLVHAQIVRRIEDRWIGFSLSRHLWTVFGKRWLGAGKVQTPVLGWIVERYLKWKENRGYSTVFIHEDTGEKLYVFTRGKPNWKTEDIVDAIVERVEVWSEHVNPPPPYTTDELLFDASRYYGYSASLTMKLAQDLFESGIITYHRTDSTRVSPAGMSIARAYLDSKGMIGEYQGRTWGSGGAHEAIRPTKPLDTDMLKKAIMEGTLRVQTKLTRAHFKLYDLIFRRFIASQMKPSRITRARVRIRIQDVIVEEEKPISYENSGFTLIMSPRVSRLHANVNPGNIIMLKVLKVSRSSSVRLYKTGDLVRLMKEQKIGRPSTYAKAIEANRRHGYIIFSKKLNYTIPTKTGITVYKYLSEHYPTLTSVETSRRLEQLLDQVEKGMLNAGEAIDKVALMITSVLDDSGLEGIPVKISSTMGEMQV
jgi:reverse gyrase